MVVLQSQLDEMALLRLSEAELNEALASAERQLEEQKFGGRKKERRGRSSRSSRQLGLSQQD